MRSSPSRRWRVETGRRFNHGMGTLSANKRRLVQRGSRAPDLGSLQLKAWCPRKPREKRAAERSFPLVKGTNTAEDIATHDFCVTGGILSMFDRQIHVNVRLCNKMYGSDALIALARSPTLQVLTKPSSHAVYSIRSAILPATPAPPSPAATAAEVVAGPPPPPTPTPPPPMPLEES